MRRLLLLSYIEIDFFQVYIPWTDPFLMGVGGEICGGEPSWATVYERDLCFDFSLRLHRLFNRDFLLLNRKPVFDTITIQDEGSNWTFLASPPSWRHSPFVSWSSSSRCRRWQYQETLFPGNNAWYGLGRWISCRYGDWYQGFGGHHNRMYTKYNSDHALIVRRETRCVKVSSQLLHHHSKSPLNLPLRILPKPPPRSPTLRVALRILAAKAPAQVRLVLLRRL